MEPCVANLLQLCKDISSLDIVAKAVSLIRERGGRVVNVDSSLIAEAPRISPYLEQRKGALGTALGISPALSLIHICNPEADAKFVVVSRMGYAALCADTGRLGEAYSEYRKVLETPGVDDRNRRCV